MLRLRMWTRIGLLALIVATSTAWVAITASPTHAITTSGASKTTDPTADPGIGGGTSAGDPDGPTGDISPTGGTLRGSTGVYGSAVQTPTVAVAKPSQQLTPWVHFKLALGFWLRAWLLRL